MARLDEIEEQKKELERRYEMEKAEVAALKRMIHGLEALVEQKLRRMAYLEGRYAALREEATREKNAGEIRFPRLGE